MEKPIELGDSWFYAKPMEVGRTEDKFSKVQGVERRHMSEMVQNISVMLQGGAETLYFTFFIYEKLRKRKC